jgi:signal transduction histidine kinase
VKLRTVRAKLLAVVLLTTGTALLFAIGGIAAYDLRAYRANAIADITAEAELLGQASAAALTFDDPAVARENLELLRQRRGLQAAALYGPRGKLYASFSRDASHAFPPLPGADGATVSGNQLIVFRRIVENGEIVGTVYLGADYLLARRLAGYLAIGLAVGAAALLLAYGVSLRLQSLVTGPLLEVAGVAQEVSEKRDFSLRARKLSEDEVGRLVDVFNGMLAEIERMTRGLHSEVAERARAESEIRRLAEELETRVKERTAQLEYINAELEAFCYSVSHDLRAPLRAVDGFSQALLEDFAKEVPEDAQRYLNRIRAATQRMGQLIEDLLNLSRVSRAAIERREVDVSAVARKVVADLQVRDPARAVEVHVWDGMRADADPRLLQAALENLVGNAWKFTAKREQPRTEVGSMRDGPRTVFFVRDNGAGFDMAYADKLFGAFQRLHAAAEYPGTGIGLATVQRIVSRHGGRIWADAQPDKGAAFFFTLDAAMEAAA